MFLLLVESFKGLLSLRQQNSDRLEIKESEINMGFPGGSDGKESACIAGNPCLIPGLRRSPGVGNGYPFQCSSLEKSMDRGAWWAVSQCSHETVLDTQQ